MPEENNNNIEKIAEFFKVLGDPTRLRIVGLLADFEDLCVGRIADQVSVTQPAVSQHLKLLKHAGIVTSRKKGFYNHYRLNFEIIKKHQDKLTSFLTAKRNKDKCKECP